MNYGRKDIPCTIVRNRKEGKRPYMDIVHINQDKQLKKKETEEETFVRRMNCIMQIEETWKFEKYDDYYRCKDVMKAEVFNRWEDNHIEVKNELREAMMEWQKESYSLFVNEYSRRMYERELKYMDGPYPWKAIVM